MKQLLAREHERKRPVVVTGRSRRAARHAGRFAVHHHAVGIGERFVECVSHWILRLGVCHPIERHEYFGQFGDCAEFVPVVVHLQAGYESIEIQ